MSAGPGTIRTAIAVLLSATLAVGCTPQKDPTPSKPAAAAAPKTTRTNPPIPPPAVPVSPALLRIPEAEELPTNWEKGADARGFHGVVTSVDRSATEAGVHILEAGGNAVDAAVATALALAVTHPSAGNIGGGGFLLLKRDKQVEAIDFRENSPAALTDKKFWRMIKGGGRGPASVGVPGTVAGLVMAHQRHGKLKWADVVAPALQLARDGYPIGARQVKTIGWAERDLRTNPVAREAFFAGGKLPAPQQVIKRPRLAIALERISEEGAAGFYEGATAKDIVNSLGDDGLLTLEDLKNYKAKLREPLFFDWAGHRVITMPAPSAGGVALTQTLLMLGAENVAKTKAGTAERLHLYAEASRRAQAERQLYVVAPESLSEKEQGEQRSRALDPQTWLKPYPIDRDRPTPSSEIHPSYAKVLAERQHTTHLSVVDRDGGLVSLTVTLSGSFGSRVFTKETGIVLNNSTGSFSSVGVNTPHPAQRTTSSMSPTLILRGDGSALVLGSPGGDTIPSTVSQLALGLVLDGLSLKEAASAARVHQTFAPGELQLERTRPIPPELQSSLRKKGHQLVGRRSTIGDANIAALIGDEALAVCDDREGGAALAAQAPPED